MKSPEQVEEKAGIIPNMTVKLEDIPGSEMEKRALEVALAGGHSLVILYNDGAMAPHLIRAGVRLAQEIAVPFHGLAYPWCPCGNYGSPKSECRCSAKVIGTHLSKLGKRLGDFTIWIGASFPLARYVDVRGEPEAVILDRIQAARSVSEPSDVLDSSCRELMDMALKQFRPLNISKVKASAGTNARLEGRDRIEANHLAEALQYQPQVLNGFIEWVKPMAVEVKAV